VTAPYAPAVPDRRFGRSYPPGPVIHGPALLPRARGDTIDTTHCDF
jgi:hypothetical protein